MDNVVHHNRNAGLAVTEAERAAKVNLITKVVIDDELLKLLNYLTSALNVTRATNTNYNFQNFFLARYIIFLFSTVN